MPFTKGYIPWNKGISHTLQVREKISRSKKVLPTPWMVNRSISEEVRLNMSIGQKKRFENKENHPRWKGGISKNVHSTKEPRYKEWRSKVFERDNWKCKMLNSKCVGGIQAHHILPWRDFIEERYIINNGITLCQFHHPRKRIDEKMLIPTFRKLVEAI